MNIYISLDDVNFDDLVRGEEIEIKDRKGNIVKIILSDIGYDNMLHCIWQAMHERDQISAKAKREREDE